MIPHWIIEKKRDGQALTEEELRFFVDRFTCGEIPDYQMAALAMAIYFRGMNGEETAVLTDAMLRSGDSFDCSAIPWPKADKHSTGGIGDKVSLALAPLVASAGVAVPMISGRGLGITGGTLDKLESIPGFKVDLRVEEALAVVARCGCCIVGQSERIVPADKKLYALRDLTATVPAVPLIVASIMSKKLAEGIDALVLDVKVGQGAFMKTMDQAESLAETMVRVGVRMGKKVTAFITEMDQPLGRTAGNALELKEAIECLRGGGPLDLRELVLTFGSEMLRLAGRADSCEAARDVLEKKLTGGEALDRFKQMVELQGGDSKAVDEPSRLPMAAEIYEVKAPAKGFVSMVDGNRLGQVCVLLGAGRSRMGEKLDHAAGYCDLVRRGEFIDAGQALVRLHAADERRLAAVKELAARAFRIEAHPVPARPLIIKKIKAD